MGFFATVLLSMFIAAVTSVGLALESHVRSERWSVKVLADSFVPDTVVIQSTIDEQIRMKPVRVNEKLGRQSEEKTLYAVTGYLIGYKREIDNDYHLILEDSATHTRMIAEIPDGYGASAPGTYRRAYRNARLVIDELVGEPPFMFSRMFEHPVKIRVTGVGFFDEEHEVAQEGMSRNFREIHPVLKVERMQ